MSAGAVYAAPALAGGGRPAPALSGAQRAAALLLLLGESEGAAIWRMLEEDEVRTISLAMAGLGTLDAGTVEALLVEFVSSLPVGGALSADTERTEGLLLKVFPAEQVAGIMDEVRGAAARRIWGSLAQVAPDVLAAFLRAEYPQTVAVVLSRVRPDYAAKVLALLPEPFAVDVLNRMLHLDSVPRDVLRHVEESLYAAFHGVLAKPPRRDAHEAMADVFNGFDRQTEARFLAALDAAERGTAQRIREKMFTFEDLLKLDPASVQTLLRRVDNALLCRALKGADEAVRGFFLAQMSTRAAKNFGDELEAMGPLRLKEVDEAQGRMTELAKELVEKGEILIPRGGIEEDLVY